jgi:D-galacturonate reductase
MSSPSHPPDSAVDVHLLRAGMVGMGMIFDETYRPFFENVRRQPLYDRRFGLCEVALAAVASRTGRRAEACRRASGGKLGEWASFAEPNAVDQLLGSGVDFVCIATPDDRHFAAAKAALEAGKHVLDRKSVV